ncbi:hypothetical protein F511_33772 [Dorcoceras hygrometricum]|uniref:Uncharacterized protein n=1 Tax=Dorcoceras hygrometricum TaxID=472368 RepID=A0A2Z7CVR7_9LAMI|nr:hypothetical protein F511_33772 [Dorcoceras hygrometricum]
MTLLMSSSLSAPADHYRSSSNLRLLSASVPASPLAPADLTSSAEHDVVTNDIIIDGILHDSISAIDSSILSVDCVEFFALLLKIQILRLDILRLDCNSPLHLLSCDWIPCRLDIQSAVASDWYIKLATGCIALKLACDWMHRACDWIHRACDWIHSNSWYKEALIWMSCCLRLVVQLVLSPLYVLTSSLLLPALVSAPAGSSSLSNNHICWSELASARLRTTDSTLDVSIANPAAV